MGLIYSSIDIIKENLVGDYKQNGIGGIYHVYNRGNWKQDIFLDEQDMNFFLYKIRQYLFPEREKMVDSIKLKINPLPENSFSLVSYCLMPNHYHFLLRQDTDVPTNKLISRVCTSYSKYFNKKYNRVGHLFQDQFKQVTVGDNDYLRWLTCYIHQNPKVAQITKNAEGYNWSSYAHYLGKRKDNIVRGEETVLSQFKNKADYKKFVEESYQIIKDRKDLEHLLID